MLSKRERNLLDGTEAALVADDPQWARQFTVLPGRRPHRYVLPVRAAVLSYLGVLLLGVVSENPAVDILVLGVLITAPAGILVALARREKGAATPAP